MAGGVCDFVWQGLIITSNVTFHSVIIDNAVSFFYRVLHSLGALGSTFAFKRQCSEASDTNLRLRLRRDKGAQDPDRTHIRTPQPYNPHSRAHLNVTAALAATHSLTEQ